MPQLPAAGLAVLMLLASAAPAAAQPLPTAPAAEQRAGTSDKSAQAALTLIRRAGRLWSSGKTEDATFWFYAGQLRMRAYLAATPDTDTTGNATLFAALMESIGRPINEHAFGDISALIATIDRVLAWDEANPDPALPAAARKDSRAGLMGLRDDIRRDAAAIRAQRTANGLENR
ncbi:hypothetical protein ACLBXM_17260 [Xanthobacteraceae bacterium A53D]